MNTQTGIVYDDRMLLHKDRDEHPECPSRITCIYNALKRKGLLDLCKIIGARCATTEELLKVHTKEYIEILTQLHKLSSESLNDLEEDYNSIYLNNNSYLSASVAAGSLIDLCDQVISGTLKNGAAIIRPPGHHAASNEASGFCILNNAAVAAANILSKGIKRILILDLDVHHGDGIQEIFLNDDRVLYISVHRYDHGSFYPGNSGNPLNIGTDQGIGKNVNIALNPTSREKVGDAEYVFLYLKLIEPMITEYNPELIILSAGFDCLIGDPLGRLQVSPQFFGYIVNNLSQLVNNKIVVTLEGGYNLKSISKAMTCCVQALLDKPYGNFDINLDAIQTSSCAVQALRTAISCHKSHWKFLNDK
jgi:histone deacetylase 6